MKKIGNRKFMTLEEFIQKDFKENPQQVDLYLEETINEYQREKNTKILVASLRDVVKARGVCYIAQKSGLNRQTIYNALSGKGNPTFNTLTVILEALGYGFDFKRIETA